MDLSTIIRLGAVLACPIAMGVMMWWMSKNMSGEHSRSMPGHQTPINSAERLAALRAQRETLEAEVAEATRLAELEARREALLAAKKSNKPSEDAAISETQTMTH